MGVSPDSEKYTASAIDNLDDSSDAGLTQDEKDMLRMGHKQELKRDFHSLSVLGLVCVLVQTWSVVFPATTFALINGGRAGAIYTFLATWACQILVAASLAEMSSMSPTAGGQYHWVSELAPPQVQSLFSYLSGWLAALGWQAFVAGTSYSSAATILILASLSHPTYEPTKWQITILTIGIGLLAMVVAVYGAKKMPLFENVILGCYILGFFAIAIPLWVLAPKAEPKEVFTDFQNIGGWAGIAGACLVGQSSAAAAFIGIDSAAHLAEEVKDAGKNVPRMMMLSVMVNGLLGFGMLLTYIFSIQDVEKQILNSTATYPFIDVWATAVGSNAGSIVMNVLPTIVGMAACVNSIMAASRQAWSFARDDGLPFSNWFTRVVTVNSTPLPLNAMIMSMVIMIVIALLNLGGSEIVQSLLGLQLGAVSSTYTLSIGCVLWRRLFGKPLPPANFSLGKFGIPINAFAVVYQAFTTVSSFFPLSAHTTAKDMNWSIAVFGGVAVLCIINYILSAHKKYRGPVIRITKSE